MPLSPASKPPAITLETLRETRLTFKAAAKLAGVDQTSVWRWAMTGLRGVKLPTIHIGRGHFVTEPALLDFLNKINDKGPADVSHLVEARQEARKPRRSRRRAA